jgi:hypothetical protein
MMNTKAKDRTNGELDTAVIAFRREPTPDNRARLMTAMEAHADSFKREQTSDFVDRTIRGT